MATKGKTHKSTVKRFKITASGKVRRDKQRSKNNSHLKNKRKARRRVVQKNLDLDSDKQAKKIKELINN